MVCSDSKSSQSPVIILEFVHLVTVTSSSTVAHLPGPSGMHFPWHEQPPPTRPFGHFDLIQAPRQLWAGIVLQGPLISEWHCWERSRAALAPVSDLMLKKICLQTRSQWWRQEGS